MKDGPKQGFYVPENSESIAIDFKESVLKPVSVTRIRNQQLLATFYDH